LKEYKASGKPLDTISFVPSELYPSFFGGKLQIVDVHCQDARGNNIAIEMQSVPMSGDRLDNNFLNQTCRSVHCVSRLYASSPAELQGKPYKDVPKAYLINFCDFIMYPHDEIKSQDPEDPCNRFNFINTASYRFRNGSQYSDVTSITVIELKKLEDEDVRGKLLDDHHVMSISEAISLYLKFAGEPGHEGLIEHLTTQWGELAMIHDKFKNMHSTANREMISIITAKRNELDQLFGINALTEEIKEQAAKIDELASENAELVSEIAELKAKLAAFMPETKPKGGEGQ
jgi:hypothetical protein